MGKSTSSSALKTINIGDIKYIKTDLSLKPNDYQQGISMLNNLEKED